MFQQYASKFARIYIVEKIKTKNQFSHIMNSSKFWSILQEHFLRAPASYLWKVKLYCTELDISKTIVFLKFLKLRCLTIILFIIILMMAWYWCEDFSSIVVLWNLSHFDGANNLENIIIFFVVWKIIPEIENKISHQYYQ